MCVKCVCVVLIGNQELKLEGVDREEMMHTNHSSDSQRSDEEGEHKLHDDNSTPARYAESTWQQQKS